MVEVEEGFLVQLSFPWLVLACLGRHQVASVPCVAGLREF